MKICIFYTSPKLGDLILQLPFIKAISKKFKTKVTICINKHLGIKSIFEKQDYIDIVVENSFRRGLFFLKDISDLSNQLRKLKFDEAYILEKTKGPAIAAKLAGIKKIFGFGIGSQKYFVNNSETLNIDDLRYNLTEQSLKFLSIFGIATDFSDKFLSLDKNFTYELNNKYKDLKRPWLTLGVDSTEVNRIWPQKNFANLVDNLIKNNLAKTIFVINSMPHTNYFKNITDNSQYEEKFIDCKNLNRNELIQLIDLSDFFIGIDSGPPCVAGALKKKAFCIFGPTDVTLPRFTSMFKIVSDIYDKNREIGIKRCGDNFAKNDFEVKTITVEKVFNKIKENLSQN